MKRKTAVILVICVILALAAGAAGFRKYAAKQASSSGETVQIRIIATSDIHGKILPYDYTLDAPETSGSLAQISSAVNEYRDESTLLIDLGDTVQGNLDELLLKDKEHPAVRAQNLMDYDAWVPGNHEFDYGMDILTDVIGQHDCDVLCANVYYKDGKSIGKPYVILERAGVKIGIIGVITPNITIWDKHNLDEAGVTVTDPVEETRKYAGELRDQVDVLAVACHMGLENENDVENSGALELAAKVPDIDLILASHGHKKEEVIENGILITENRDAGRTANIVTLTMEKDADGSYKVAERENSFIKAADYPADSKICDDELIISADERSRAFADQTIARLTNDSLAPEDEIPGISQSKVQDTALVRLINEALEYYSGCSIAAIDLDAGSPNFYKGDIKRKDIANLYRFENTVCKVRMTGSHIRKWIEYSAGFFNTYHEGDLSVSFDPDFPAYEYVMFSGLKYEIDISQPAGSRVRGLALEDGTPLDPDGKYEVATNDYLANSHLLNKGTVFGDGDELPELIESDVKSSIGGIREMITDYIVNVKGVKDRDGISEFTAEDVTEENAAWKIVGFDWDAEKHMRAVDMVKEGMIRIEDHQDESGAVIHPITEADLGA